MTTKVDIINKAYSRGRISGLTVSPTPEDLSLALDRLENMASEWAAQNICVGYNFETTPGINSIHNIPRQYWNAFESNLMTRLLPDFGKEPTAALSAIARTTFSRMSAQTAVVPRTTYPSRQPLGSGNTRWNRYQRYFGPIEKAATECATAKMVVDDVDNFYEDYTAYLDSGETIASYDLTSDDALTTSSDSISGSRIIYTVTATGVSDDEVRAVYQVKIVMTTSASRIETRIKNFELTDIEI